MLIFGSIIVVFEHLFPFDMRIFCNLNVLIINHYANAKKNCILLFLFVGLSLFAQQDYMVSSYVRGNFTTVVVSLQKACGQVTTLFS